MRGRGGPVVLAGKKGLSVGLLVSLLAHAIILAALAAVLSLAPLEKTESYFSVELLGALPQSLKPYVEHRRVAVGATRAQKPAPSRKPRVAAVNDVVMIKKVPPQATTSPEKNAEPPALPGPEPTPVEESTPSESGETAVLQREPEDMRISIDYENDRRIPRGEDGTMVLDPDALSSMENVKPLLIGVPELSIPPDKAKELNLVEGDKLKAVVTIEIKIEKYGAPVLMPPSRVEVESLEKEQPPSLTGENKERIAAYIKELLLQTRWFPAMDLGVPKDSSIETFPLTISPGKPDSAKAIHDEPPAEDAAPHPPGDGNDSPG